MIRSFVNPGYVVKQPRLIDIKMVDGSGMNVIQCSKSERSNVVAVEFMALCAKFWLKLFWNIR